MSIRVPMRPVKTSPRPFGLEALRHDLTAQARLLGADSLLPPKRSKYGAVKTEADGHVFDSKREAIRYGELKLLERSGYIRQIELQPAYTIVINGITVCKVILDFEYWEGAVKVTEDLKGRDNALSRLKRKLVEAQHGIKVRVVK